MILQPCTCFSRYIVFPGSWVKISNMIGASPLDAFLSRGLCVFLLKPRSTPPLAATSGGSCVVEKKQTASSQRLRMGRMNPVSVGSRAAFSGEEHPAIHQDWRLRMALCELTQRAGLGASPLVPAVCRSVLCVRLAPNKRHPMDTRAELGMYFCGACRR